MGRRHSLDLQSLRRNEVPCAKAEIGHREERGWLAVKGRRVVAVERRVSSRNEAHFLSRRVMGELGLDLAPCTYVSDVHCRRGQLAGVKGVR